MAFQGKRLSVGPAGPATILPAVAYVIGRVTMLNDQVVPSAGTGFVVERTDVGHYDIHLTADGGVPGLLSAAVRTINLLDSASAYKSDIVETSKSEGRVSFVLADLAAPDVPVDPAFLISVVVFVAVQNENI